MFLAVIEKEKSKLEKKFEENLKLWNAHMMKEHQHMMKEQYEKKIPGFDSRCDLLFF